jgi:formate dehydrogenase subunit gamma
MALSHVIHTIAGIIMIAVSFGHIYLGTAGMQGSFSSMGTGYVDENWAKAHHDRWYEEIQANPHEQPDQDTAAGGVAATGKAGPVADG